jgi:hypothetical protein
MIKPLFVVLYVASVVCDLSAQTPGCIFGGESRRRPPQRSSDQCCCGLSRVDLWCENRADTGSALTGIRESEIMAATVITPMITSILLRARPADEPGAGIRHAGISEGDDRQRAVQSKWRGR